MLRLDAVRTSIAGLQKRPIHPYFPAYLYLRQLSAIEGSLDGLKPRWKDLGRYLAVAGAPATKPYFRPFWDGTPQSGQEWLNNNLAGSFAGSSLRAGKPPMLVVDYDTNTRTFSLRKDHWKLARRHLLDDKQIPLEFMFGFFLRDHAIETDGAPPSSDDVVDLFRDEFGYGDSDDEEVFELYDLTFLDSGVVNGWFEPFDED